MYTSFFGFQESPFSIAPNPRYLYMSDQHREALAHLQYGINSTGGFVMLSGEVGAGKTTLCRSLLQTLPDDIEIAFIFNPAQTSQELFLAICEELGIETPASAEGNLKKLQALIYQHLLATHADGRNTLLIVDEAQSLPMPVLEQLRLLTNLETDEQKLLKIILLGQPELRDLIAHPSLRQFSQRITARFHLQPLGESDIQPYIQHRLSIAGGSGQLFDQQVYREVYRLSNGIPRLINVLCDRALLGAYTRNLQHIDLTILAQAAQETLGTTPEQFAQSEQRRFGWLPAGLAASLLLASGGYWLATNNEAAIDTVKALTETTAAKTQPAAVAIAPAEPPAPAVTEVEPSVTPAAIAPAIIEPPSSEEPALPENPYAVLLSLWQPEATSIAGIAPCDSARKFGLRCLNGNGSLQELARLNRPAVLRLASTSGLSNVVLTRLNSTEATVIENRQARVLPVSTLEQLWTGEYTLIWRPPTGYRSALRTGINGEPVSWLKARLVTLTSAPLDQSDPIFNSELEFWVRAFQRSRGLSQDGVAGPHTLIHLNSVTSTEVPLLKANRG